MSSSTTPSFVVQRTLLLALLLSMTLSAIAAAVVIQQNGGKGLADAPVTMLDTVTLVAGCVLGVGALVARLVLQRVAASREGARRAWCQFVARLLPLAMLEAGCLLALVAWLLNGNAVPNLVIALVLLSLAIATVPLQDPDQP